MLDQATRTLISQGERRYFESIFQPNWVADREWKECFQILQPLNGSSEPLWAQSPKKLAFSHVRVSLAKDAVSHILFKNPIGRGEPELPIQEHFVDDRGQRALFIFEVLKHPEQIFLADGSHVYVARTLAKEKLAVFVHQNRVRTMYPVFFGSNDPELVERQKQFVLRTQSVWPLIWERTAKEKRANS